MNGTNGNDGQTGQTGPQGPQGDAGPAGRDFRFTAEGVKIRIVAASITDAGVATADIAITDNANRPLDRTGTFSEGAVSVSFVIAALNERSDGLPLQYSTYTTRTVPADGGTMLQNGTDTGGTWTELEPIGSGNYRYQFGTVVDASARLSQTHTVGLYATRTFAGVRYVDNQLFHFRPDGQAVTKKREIITTAGCDVCHTRLEAHGGARREVGLCILCHTTTNDIDPESGNTIDFKNMVHNIHRGSSLPSVDAGSPYYFIGFNNTRLDFSDVQFPRPIGNCEVCHTGPDGARWKTNPSSEACTGCHDRTWFAASTPPPGWTGHTGGPRADSQCIVCHDDASIEPIARRHLWAGRDATRLDVQSSILSIPTTPPGTRPSVTFSVTVNGAPRDVLSQRLSRLRVVTGGPNDDVARYWSETAETAADCTTVTDGGACLARVDAGIFTYRASTALAANDTGSFTMGLEVCATTDAGVRWCATNPVKPFAVTDATPIARRAPVTLGQCNACHASLAAHGGTRTNVEHCVICHNANTVQRAAVPLDGGVATAEAANFKNLIHTAHANVPFPSPLNRCVTCHTAAGWQIPVPVASLPSRSELQTCGLLPDGGSGAPTDGGLTCVTAAILATPVFQAPTTAACTSCHSTLPAEAHAALNTTASGLEACAVCHQAGRSTGIDLVHAVAP
ncbi:MAG: OmcA/MtrC family decaheme c-type cytochrome [Myxococcaceae bacterium]